MSENHKNLLMWQHPSGVGGSQPNFAAIINAGRPTTCRKKRRRSVMYFLRKSDQKDQYKLEAVLAVRVTRAHYRWCHLTEDKISYISSAGTICLSCVVLELWCKNKIAKKRKLVANCYGNVPWGIKNRGSVRSAAAIVEPNGENRMKIRPVEVEIICWQK